MNSILIIKKTDLDPMVVAPLEIIEADAKTMRRDKPVVFSNIKTGAGLDEIAVFIKDKSMLIVE